MENVTESQKSTRVLMGNEGVQRLSQKEGRDIKPESELMIIYKIKAKKRRHILP